MLRLYEECHSTQDVHHAVGEIFETYSHLFPLGKTELVFIKPNLNSDMCALTGNTTDLRVIISVVKNLQERGYTNIAIGDGANCGVYNAGIDNLYRLRLNEIGRLFGVSCLDLNHAPGTEFSFGEQTIKLAEICRQAALFINLPKIKTHGEMVLSCALKNMIGCAIGIEKRKIHYDLARNILRLNKYLRPHLHIVDGLIGMEGNGPSAGIPVEMNLLLAGDNPYLVDMAVAKLTGIELDAVGYLQLARKEGRLASEFFSKVKVTRLRKRFLRPRPPLLQAIVSHPKLGVQFFDKIRYAPGIINLLSSNLFGKLLFLIGVRQEQLDSENDQISSIRVDASVCAQCIHKPCLRFCPMELEPFALIQDSKCITCLYCFWVCPKNAVSLVGEKKYLGAYISLYKLYCERDR